MINGIPSTASASSDRSISNAVANVMRQAGGDLNLDAAQRQEHLLQRLQAREITPLELLILREFVEHLQQNREGASMNEIDSLTASWTVEDVSKIPEELRSCCVCLDDVCVNQCVRTLPCLHSFHAGCAEEWLKKKKVCPLCQIPIDGENGVEAEGDGTGPVAANPSTGVDVGA